MTHRKLMEVSPRFFLVMFILVSAVRSEDTEEVTENQPSILQESIRVRRATELSSNNGHCTVHKNDPRSTDPEHKLIKHLMGNYEINARPSLDKSKPVDVSFDLAFNQIVELDGRRQTLRSKVWLRQFWKNPYLTWNKSEHCNISFVIINSKYIWKPDVVLYNSIGQDAAIYNRDYLIKVHSTGDTEWYCPVEISSICKINIKNFPFDSQTCKLKFGSWAYTGAEVNLRLKNSEADLVDYTENGEWEMVGIPGKRNVKRYTCCPNPYIDITYTIKIKRRVLFYINNLILPCIVLGALTVLAFYLPPESGERVSLVITVLLGLTVFMLLYNESIPPTSEAMPLIGKYFFVVLLEVTGSLLATCLTIRCYHHNPFKEMPRWFRYVIFYVLAPIFRLQFPKRTLKIQERRRPSLARLVQHNKQVYTTMPNGKFGTQWNNNAPLASPRGSRASLEKIPSEMGEDKLDSITQQMDILLDYFDNEQNVDVKRDEWHFASIVLDQVFFWLFTATIIFSVLSFYLMIP